MGGSGRLVEIVRTLDETSDKHKVPLVKGALHLALACSMPRDADQGLFVEHVVALIAALSTRAAVVELSECREAGLQVAAWVSQ